MRAINNLPNDDIQSNLSVIQFLCKGNLETTLFANSFFVCEVQYNERDNPKVEANQEVIIRVEAHNTAG